MESLADGVPTCYPWAMTDRASPPAGSTRVRRVALVTAAAVVVVMYPIFQVTDGVFGDAVDGYLGWAAGIAVYWILFGIGFSTWALGRHRIGSLLRPGRPSPGTVALVSVPAVVALAGRLADADPGGEVSRTASVLLLGVAVGNGVFEEVFWRGVFLDLFPGQPVWGMAWPSLWFGVWHLAPVSIAGGSPGPLMVAAAFLGLYLAFIANRTNSVWWPIVAHTLAGVVTVV